MLNLTKEGSFSIRHLWRDVVTWSVATNKTRQTLYINPKVAEEVKEVSDELGISLSKLTEHLYVYAIGIKGLTKNFERISAQIEERYPEGIPEEKMGEVVLDLLSTMQAGIQKLMMYNAGMLMGANPADATLPDFNFDLEEVMREGFVESHKFTEMLGVGDWIEAETDSDTVDASSE